MGLGQASLFLTGADPFRTPYPADSAMLNATGASLGPDDGVGCIGVEWEPEDGLGFVIAVAWSINVGWR